MNKKKQVAKKMRFKQDLAVPDLSKKRKEYRDAWGKTKSESFTDMLRAANPDIKFMTANDKKKAHEHERANNSISY